MLSASITFQGAYGCLKTIRAVFALTCLMLRIESQPERDEISHLGLIFILHVKITSAAVTGFPSLHFACGLILTSSVNSLFLTTFPLPMYGTCANFGFVMYTLPSASITVHDVQVLLHPSRTPFRQGGSCSAPKTMVPAVALCGAPPAAPATTRLMVAISAPRMSLRLRLCMHASPPF